MPPEQAPSQSGGPPKEWVHRALYDNVVKTLYALPEEFETSLRIADFRATDIFTLNAALGASIEDAVVRGLNSLRDMWDPGGQYAVYRFERQAQVFPDVRLVTDAPDLPQILMGIELKGWFALSKEGEPTFRYQVTPEVCAPADLLVIFPWVLSDIVAGSPHLLRPYVGEARYSAELRNYYWRQMRVGRNGNPDIVTAAHRQPYPNAAAQCLDRAVDDGGGNFGRIARYGALDDYVKAIKKQDVSGIPVAAWLSFFKVFGDGVRDTETVVSNIESLFRSYAGESPARKQALIESLERVIALLREEAPEPKPRRRK